MYSPFLMNLILLSYVYPETKEFVVMFSGKVQKWNPYGLKQDRNLIITNERLYNFKKKSKSTNTPTGQTLVYTPNWIYHQFL